MFWIGLVIGVFIGTLLGILIMGMCAIAGEADQNSLRRENDSSSTA